MDGSFHEMGSLLDAIQLNRESEKPLYRQLSDALRSLILSGRLSDRAKLPSTRELAERLRVNRATIVGAYRALGEEGWVKSGVGAGTFVTHRAVTEPIPIGSDQFWSSRIDELPRPETETVPQATPRETIRFTSPTADPDAFPVAEFRAAIEAVFEREGAACLDYGPADGYGPLRETIRERLATQGVEVDRSQIILVNGSQQGLELIFRLLVPRGRTLLVESPTYQLALRTSRTLGLPVRSIPIDQDGLRLDRLESILDSTSAGLLYTMPVFQNPTGLTLSKDRREGLLAIAESRNLPIVEDHYDAELDYEGGAPGPLLAEGNRPNVILLGTISKILFPAPRVGWLVVPKPLIGPLSELKVCADLSNGLLTQMALHQFCRQGLLDEHLQRIRRRNARRLSAMLSALAATMPPGVRWTRPSGGMTLWLSLPSGVDSDLVAQEALRRGVAASSGTAFYVDGGGHDGLRLCFIREGEERIRKGIGLLAETIEEIKRTNRDREGEGAAAPIL